MESAGEQAPAGVEAIVTNPPYDRRINHLVRHMLKLVPKVYLLLQIEFQCGTSRLDLIDQIVRIHTFRNRLHGMHQKEWLEAGNKTASPVNNHAWFVWDQTDFAITEWRSIQAIETTR
jgi:hypothetical protein